MSEKRRRNPFHSAETEAKEHAQTWETPQAASSAYRLAFADPDFLLNESLRPIRLQLELLKPELLQQEENIESTIVVYGSARIPEPAQSEKALLEAERALEFDPSNPELQQTAKIAKRMHEKSRYYTVAREFAALVANASKSDDGVFENVIVTGGGPGIMEAANRGAHDASAKSIGLNIVLPHEEAPNPYITPSLAFRFHYFAIRKMHFLIRARALVVFPGGFGTMDELFEALTLLQNHKIEPMPVLLIGREFWTRVICFDTLVEEGVISPSDIEWFQYAETAEEAWQVINDFYA